MVKATKDLNMAITICFVESGVVDVENDERVRRDERNERTSSVR